MNVIDIGSGRAGSGRASETPPPGDDAMMSEAARGVAHTLRRASLSPAEPALMAASLDFAAATLAFSLAAATGPEGLDARDRKSVV